MKSGHANLCEGINVIGQIPLLTKLQSPYEFINDFKDKCKYLSLCCAVESN